jgi:antitoxin HigA-1
LSASPLTELGNTPFVSTTSGASAFIGQTWEPNMSKSSIATEENQLINPHPGDIIMEEFLKPLLMSQNALAKALKVNPGRINEIVLGKRAVTAETDLRLARYFGMSEGFFMGLQADYELMEAKRRLGNRLEEIIPKAA